MAGLRFIGPAGQGYKRGMGAPRMCRPGFVSLLVLWAASAVAAPPAELKPFVQKYCAECHDDSVQKGDLDHHEADPLPLPAGPHQTLDRSAGSIV